MHPLNLSFHVEWTKNICLAVLKSFHQRKWKPHQNVIQNNENTKQLPVLLNVVERNIEKHTLYCGLIWNRIEQLKVWGLGYKNFHVKTNPSHLLRIFNLGFWLAGSTATGQSEVTLENPCWYGFSWAMRAPDHVPIGYAWRWWNPSLRTIMPPLTDWAGNKGPNAI